MNHSTAALDEARRLLATLAPVGLAMDDSTLLDVAAGVERVGRAIDSLRLQVAAEVARRSARDLGREGLSARLGHRTPSGLLSSVTGVSGKNADRRSRVGLLVESTPGFSPLSEALATGSLDADAIKAIAVSLAPTSGWVPVRALDAEVAALVELAASAPVDELAAAAGSARDRLDRQHVAERDLDRRTRRYVRFGREVDGMVPLYALLPPEEAGVVKSYFDSRTSVRRGVGFSAARRGAADPEETVKDDRTMDQLRADTLVELCARGAGSGSNLPSAGSGTLVVTIGLTELESGIATARVDGIRQPISASAARRIACNANILPFVLGAKSQPLDLGYSRRLFSAAQRRALIERDRGCATTGCEAPPGWTEAHHVTPWSRSGPTDLANGVMLCSFHHHLVHEGALIVELNGLRPTVRESRGPANVVNVGC